MESETPENKLIEEIDAIGGLKIQIWTDDFQHALDGHPEVSIEAVRKTVKDPIKVIESKKSNRACLFYSMESEAKNGEKIYFCVVISVLGEGKGKMETAYETTAIKNGKIIHEKEALK